MRTLPVHRTARTICLAACLIPGVALLASAQPARADVLANWTFEVSLPTNAGPHTAEEGVFASDSFAGVSHQDIATVYSSPAGNGSAHSYSASWWLVNDAYFYYTKTTGYDSLTISFDQTRSAGGPSVFELGVSLNGLDFTTIATYAVTPVTWDSSVTQAASSFGTFSVPDLADDQEFVAFRFRATTTASSTSQTVRMDNVVISGSPVPAPAGACTIAGACLIAARRRRQR